MRSTWLLSLACVITLASFLCIADDATGAQAAKKESKRNAAGQIDTNGDGKASYEEMKAAFPGVTEEKFKVRDKNGDGFLTREERLISDSKTKAGATTAVQKAAQAEPGQMFKKADRDGNGQVTWEEVHAVAPRFPQARFNGLDRNGDGAITKEELPAHSPAASAEKLMADEKKPSIEQLARKADKDRSGSVTFEEMQAVLPNLPRGRFDEMDKNQDGVLSPSDRAQADRDNKQGADEAISKLLETDADKDGKLTFEELTTAKSGFPREAFDQVDRNKDGVISSADSKKQ